ncbi:MAG: PilC/PilY family type IV pilus protein [Pseudomonadota bacterium]
MTTLSTPRRLAILLGAGAALGPGLALADDIDIFTGASAGSSINPRILIVLDNTANWSRQSQQWPGGVAQGQSEANAIKTVLGSLGSNVNLGLMEFVTGGNANQNGGFIRAAVKPLTAANKTTFSASLTTIYNNITDPNEKRNANTPFGNLMYDAYSYYAGGNSLTPSAIVTSLADASGYSTPYSVFASPLDAGATCGKDFIIFIGNPDSRGPTSDDAANTAALAALGGTTTQLGLPNFTVGNATQTTSVGNTNQCYASPTAASAGLTDYAATCSTYTEGCSIGGAVSNSSPIACPAGQLSYTVKQSIFTPASTVTSAGTPIVGTSTTNSGSTTGYYASSAAVNATTDHGTLTCPSTTSTTSGNNTATVTYSCTYAVGAAIGSATPATSTSVTNAPGLAAGAGCYAETGSTNVGTAAGQWNPNTSTDIGTLVCPANNTCTYSGVESSNSSGCSGSHNRTVIVTQTATPKRQYTITQTVTPTTVNSTSVTTPASTAVTNLGYTSQCYASAPSSTSDFASQCTGTNISCTYNNTPTSTTLASCPAGTSEYAVVGTNIVLTNVATGSSTLDSAPFNADEWARFMHDKGVPVAGTTIRPSITTYTIDVYNKQPNATHTSLLMSMAKAGGGKYFAATNEQAIVDALKQIVVEILAVNSSFASTSLPVNATNRSQNENQVFIGMFRPDPDAKPRWFGNLKRYQLVANGAGVELGDVNGLLAVNPLTGFVTPCATSYWTSDSGTYWAGLGINPDPAGACSITTNDPYSDAPDGPQVEKGAVAEVIRKGNNPSTTNNAPTWAVNRTIYTAGSGALTPFSSASSGLGDSLVRFIRGEDPNDEKGTGQTTLTRPSLHGDVIHSRPLPVNYGGSGVTVFYGANDGAFRAVDASSGTERWAFIAPEFFTRLSRLKDNSPLVSYPNVSAATLPAPRPKDYFFDGSTGVYQNTDSSKVWVIPTMRRGGRMIYALDVSSVTSPSLKWGVGCPNLSDDVGCTAGMSSIGQTWSTPSVAFIKGYGSSKPVVVVGGGYDGCEDADTSAPSCGATKGGIVYVLDGDTGVVLNSFPTTRAVASDIAMVDIDNDGMPDYAYAADTGGNIYRIDFISDPVAKTPLVATSWRSHRIAYTNGAGRKFLFAPALLNVKDKVYVAIGTGDREHPLQANYPYASVINRFYVYKDDLNSTLATPARDLDTMLDYTSDSTCNTAQVLPDSGLDGWFMNLNQYGQGEQVVTSALIASGMVTFSTNRPVPSSAASCATSLGKAQGYWVNLFNASGAISVPGTCGGTRASEFVGGGLPPSPVMASAVPVNGKAVSVVIGAVQKDGGASVAISPQKVRPSISSKRKVSYSSTTGQ